MEKNVVEIIEEKKSYLTESIDELLVGGSDSKDVLLMMKDMVQHLRPITTIEEHLDME